MHIKYWLFCKSVLHKKNKSYINVDNSYIEKIDSSR